MRRTALETHVLDQVRAIDDADRNDIRDALIAEQEADPDGAFGALCHWIDVDREATRDQVTDTFGRAFAAIDDRTADRIEGGGEG